MVRKILVISNLYPPSNSAQSLQSGRVVEALSLIGYEVRVIAAASATFSGDVTKGVHYIRQRLATTQNASVYSRCVAKVNRRILRPLWVLDASRAAKDLYQSFCPDAVLSIAQPIDSHEVAWQLLNRRRTPWIAYFSDPLPPSIAPEPYRHRLPVVSSFAEGRVRAFMKRADGIVLSNCQVLPLFERALQIEIAGKTAIIPHIGASPRVDDSESPQYDGWLMHIGEITRHRVSPSLLDALVRIKGRRSNTFPGLLCIGNVCPDFRGLVTSRGLDDFVKCIGPLPAEQTQRLARGAGALMLIEANMPTSVFLPSKLSDYVMQRIPILAITPADSPVRDYLARTKVGIAVDHDAAQITEALIELSSNRDRFLAIGVDVSSEFGIKSVAEQYQAIIEKAASRHHSRRA